MALRGEPRLGAVRCLKIECADCGRERWLQAHEILRGKVTEATLLSDYMNRLVCADCREEDLPGRNLVAIPVFYEEAARRSAENWRTSTRVALARG